MLNWGWFTTLPIDLILHLNLTYKHYLKTPELFHLRQSLHLVHSLTRVSQNVLWWRHKIQMKHKEMKSDSTNVRRK